MIRHLPVVAVLQRRLLQSWNGRSFDHTIDAGPAKGLRYRVQMPQDKAIWTGQYEPRFSEWLAHYSARASVCYDVGAFHGYFSGLMHVNGAEKVFAFEPLDCNRDLIQHMISLNPGCNVTVMPFGVSDRDGSEEFLVSDDDSMGKLASSRFQQTRDDHRIEQIRTRSLDSLVDEQAIPAPDLIKVDVEGTELDVLRGARRLLAEKAPILCVEIHTKRIERQLAAMLAGCGYTVQLRDADHDYSRGANHLLATSKD